MKRIAALLAVALVGLAACTKEDGPQSGRYAAQETALIEAITLNGGKCQSAEVTGLGILDGWMTKGSWPDYTYAYETTTARITIYAHFLETAYFTANADGMLLTGDGATAFETTRPINYRPQP